MSFATKQVSITGAATAVAVYGHGVDSPSPEFGRDIVVTIANLDTADTVYVGGSSAVDDSDGFPVGPEASASFVLSPGDDLYVYSANDADIAAAASGQ